MGNVQFIDQVGQCFSAMHSIEEYWNGRMTEVEQANRNIEEASDEYEGSNMAIRVIRSEKMRNYFESIASLRAWLLYSSALLRYHNRRNMESIGITEQEVMDYTNARAVGEEGPNDVPAYYDFYKGRISADSLTTLGDLDARLEELKNENL